jgi:hypothetical protein
MTQATKNKKKKSNKIATKNKKQLSNKIAINQPETIIDNQPETITEQKVIVLDGKVSGKKLSQMIAAKIQSNKDYKSSEGSISKMLKNVAEFGGGYLTELNNKHNTSINAEFILSNVNQGKEGIELFLNFANEKEKAQATKKAEKLGKNSPVFTFWSALSFIGRYCEANKVKAAK